jgi:phage baseplate assembly protein W
MSAPKYEITPTFPIVYGEGHGYETIPQGDEIEVIKFHLKNIVLTNPGEKLSDPNFGVGLKRYLFELETSGNTTELRQSIISQIQTYANYFTKLNVLVDLSKLYESTLTVRIEFQFAPDNITDYLEITVTS